MTTHTVNVAPTAATIVALYTDNDAAPDGTFAIASEAQRLGLGHLPIDRLSLRLVVDGQPVTAESLAELQHDEPLSA